jgi:hypothetical protein
MPLVVVVSRRCLKPAGCGKKGATRSRRRTWSHAWPIPNTHTKTTRRPTSLPSGRMAMLRFWPIACCLGSFSPFSMLT